MHPALPLRSSLRLLVTATLLLAWVPTLAAQRFEARLFDQKDGLGNLSILALAQDRAGYLWVATANGLFRYDGANFTEFGREDGLAISSVPTLLVDSTGTLWAGTHSGLFWFDGKRFEQVRLDGRPLRVGMNSMLAATPDGELIAQSERGPLSVERSPGGGWNAVLYRQRHPSAGNLADTNGIAVDGEGHLVIGCGYAICVHADAGMEVMGEKQGVPPDYYVALFRARDGRLWARGRKHIVTWRAGESSVREVTGLLPSGTFTTIYRRFAEDAAGNILTPTALGFASWDGHSWTETRSTSAGPLDGATELLVDREGAVWIGTEGAGLLESRGYRRWANFGIAEGLASAHIYAIARDQAGRIWLAGNQAISLLLPGSPVPVASPLAAEADATDILSFAPDPEGGMWAATELGHVYHVTAEGRVDYRALIDAYIRRICLGRDQELWLATNSGLFLLHAAEGHREAAPLPFAELPRNSMRDMEIDSAGRLWIAGDSGLDLIDGAEALHVPVVGSVSAGKLAQAFSALALMPDGTLWLGGQTAGVARIRIERPDAGHAAGHVVESYGRPRLSSDTVNFLAVDAQQRLWVGSDAGVNVIEGASVRSITDEDGLLWNDTERAFLTEPDGSVWIGTSRGVSHLLQPESVLTRSPFKAAVGRVDYRGRPVETGAVPWDNGPMLVRFSGLTFRNNQSLLYHYQLLGFDATEVTTHSPYVRFQKLPPGNYTFRVVAEDTVHGVFSTPAELSFSLTPPWWRTWSFDALLVVASLLLMMRIWRWRHLALLAQRQKLERLVAERTRELEQMAVRDALTGLLNRRAILERLDAELRDAKKNKTALCVAMIDLDHFKQVNDTCGHLAGDAVLRHSAERLQGAVRGTDVVGRYGGEEFIILFRDVDRAFGMERCERVRAALCREPIAFEDKRLAITCSIGLACSLDEGMDAARLIARADDAMYVAKHGGRNRVVCSVAA